jgi:uncharacterized membrane protein YfcA
MEVVIIAISAFVVSMLTFFSGLGLGTILTPVFALFFPIELAIALILAAMTGAFIGYKLMEKVTLSFIHMLVAFMLIIISLAIGSGLIYVLLIWKEEKDLKH